MNKENEIVELESIEPLDADKKFQEAMDYFRNKIIKAFSIPKAYCEEEPRAGFDVKTTR